MPVAAKSQTQQLLAGVTIALSAIGITLVGAVIVTQTGAEARQDRMQVFTILVPVFASWVGTVLAFYFGRDNFVAASEQVRDLVSTVSANAATQPTLTASEVMAPVAEVVSFRLTQGQTTANVHLTTLKQRFEIEQVGRLPILDADGRPLFMIHKGEVQAFLNQPPQTGNQPTLADLVSRTAGRRYGPGEGFLIVAPKTKIDGSMASLLANSPAADLFVTLNASTDSPLLGWISDERLARALAPLSHQPA